MKQVILTAIGALCGFLIGNFLIGFFEKRRNKVLEKEMNDFNFEIELRSLISAVNELRSSIEDQTRTSDFKVGDTVRFIGGKDEYTVSILVDHVVFSVVPKFLEPKGIHMDFPKKYFEKVY